MFLYGVLVCVGVCVLVRVGVCVLFVGLFGVLCSCWCLCLFV